MSTVELLVDFNIRNKTPTQKQNRKILEDGYNSLHRLLYIYISWSLVSFEDFLVLFCFFSQEC